MTIFFKIKTLGSAVLLFAIFTPLCVATEHDSSLGVLYGVGAYNYEGGTNQAYGASLHKKWLPNFGIGLTVANSQLDPVNHFDNLTKVHNIFMLHVDADLSYHFTTMLNGLWLGARLGYGRYTATMAAFSLNLDYASSGFEWGPVVGYDHKIANDFSIGADLSYVSSAIKTLNGHKLGAFQALSAFKYLF